MSPLKGGKKIQLGGMVTLKKSASQGNSLSFIVRICESTLFILKNRFSGSNYTVNMSLLKH